MARITIGIGVLLTTMGFVSSYRTDDIGWRGLTTVGIGLMLLALGLTAREGRHRKRMLQAAMAVGVVGAIVSIATSRPIPTGVLIAYVAFGAWGAGRTQHRRRRRSSSNGRV